MARKINNGRAPKKIKPAVAIVVDGKDESLYLTIAKGYYCEVRPALRSVKVKPELPTDKKVAELFEYAKDLLNQAYTHVILVLDFDDPLNKEDEYEQFAKYYGWYQKVHDSETKLAAKHRNEWGWMKNLTLVVNNPCLEYWYLLHFAKGNVVRFYKQYSPELESDVRKQPGFDKYDKSEDFYRKKPDIFTRLGGLDGLAHARSFKQEFRLETCREQGVSEMKKVFDYFDTIDAE